jgi:hypothetical protein
VILKTRLNGNPDFYDVRKVRIFIETPIVSPMGKKFPPFFEFRSIMIVFTKYRLWALPDLRGLFLGAFAKFRKATISFVMSACPSVRMEQLSSNLTHIREAV